MKLQAQIIIATEDGVRLGGVALNIGTGEITEESGARVLRLVEGPSYDQHLSALGEPAPKVGAADMCRRVTNLADRVMVRLVTDGLKIADPQGDA